MRLTPAVSGSALALTIVSTSFAGPDWVEDGDAGSSLQSAQVVTNVVGGQVRRIVGQLSGNPTVAGGGGDYEDVYLINIVDPEKFMISTAPEYGGNATFQTSLWLFDYEGFGQLANVYSPQSPVSPPGGDVLGGTPILGSTLLNFATDGTGFVITKPGLYYLAITGVPNHPLASGPTEGQDIFLFDQFDEISGPDGPGAAFPFIKWWWGEGQTGSYSIVLEGVGEVPAPGAFGLLLLAGMRGRGRRRSRA